MKLTTVSKANAIPGLETIPDTNKLV